MKLGACGRLRLRPETGAWYRALEPQHFPAALGTTHTRGVLSRFSPGHAATPPFEILYLTVNHMVTLWEVGAMHGDPQGPGSVIPDPRLSWAIIRVEVRLQGVADLTQVSPQRLLGTTAQELTGDWRGYQLRGTRTPVSEPVGLAPTQALGAALFSLPGLEGFRTLPARLPYRANLVVFPEKLRPGSRLEFRHPPTGQTHVVEPRRQGRRRSR